MRTNSKKHETPTDANNMLVTVTESFIGWRDKLHKEMHGGKLMFDVPKHYKWLDESELFTYWMNVVAIATNVRAAW